MAIKTVWMVARGPVALGTEDDARLIQSATARMAPRLSVEGYMSAETLAVEVSKIPDGWPHSLPGNASL